MARPRWAVRSLVVCCALVLAASCTSASPKAGSIPTRVGSPNVGRSTTHEPRFPAFAYRKPVVFRGLLPVALLYGTLEDSLVGLRLTDHRQFGVSGPMFNNPRGLSCVSSASYTSPVLEQSTLLLVVGPTKGCYDARAFGLRMDHGRPPTRFGAAWDVFPDSGGRVWVIKETGSTWLAQLTNLDGTELGVPVALPVRPIAHTDAGFLIVHRGDPQRSEIDVLSDTTGRLLRVLTRGAGGVLAVSRRLIAWRASVDDCGRCPLHLADVMTGRDQLVGLPPGTEGPIAGGSFSPDGDSLALAFQQVGGTHGIAVLIDTRSGKSRIVPGSAGIEPWGTTGGVVWSPSGDRFFFLDTAPPWRSSGGLERTGTYRLGAPRCALVPGSAPMPSGLLLAVPTSAAGSSS